MLILDSTFTSIFIHTKEVMAAGSTVNRFFPSLGNHDLYTDNANPYFNYFELPGNERYYDFIHGNVHCFVINSEPT